MPKGKKNNKRKAPDQKERKKKQKSDEPETATIGEKMILYHDVFSRFNEESEVPIEHEDIKQVKKTLTKILDNSWFLPDAYSTVKIVKCATLLFSIDKIDGSLKRYRDMNSENGYYREYRQRDNLFHDEFYELMETCLEWKPHSRMPPPATTFFRRQRAVKSMRSLYPHRMDLTIRFYKFNFANLAEDEFLEASKEIGIQQTDYVACCGFRREYAGDHREIRCLYHKHMDGSEEMECWELQVMSKFSAGVPHEIMLSTRLLFVLRMMHVYVACGVSREMVCLFQRAEGIKKWDEVFKARKDVFTLIEAHLPPVLVEMVGLYMV